MTPEQVLIYWFGDPPAIDSPRWFSGTAELDREIRDQFGDAVRAAVAGELEAWASTPQGCVALFVVLDQFSRNVFRGTPDMFAGDVRAQALAQELLREDAVLCVPHRAALYLGLTHSEDEAVVADAVERFAALRADPASRGFRKPLKRMHGAARRHLRTLRRFGRYPHRNTLLGRTSTDGEIAWLATATHRFVRSVRPHATQKLTLLVLHSFRQSGPRLRSRMRALEAHLEDIADLVYVDAPHPYTPDERESEMLVDDFGAVPDFRHQRCWWNADDEGAYQGAEASLRYLSEHLPVDGVLGFSQGGAMAGLLAALHPTRLRFAICVSGFPARSEAHAAWMAPGSIDLPSLHVYGTQDVLVDNERTKALAACFVDPEIVSHEGGHFFPDRWPKDVIRSFVLPFVAELPAPPQLEDDRFTAIATLDDARRVVAEVHDVPSVVDEARQRRHSWMAPAPRDPDTFDPSDRAHLVWIAAHEVAPLTVVSAVQADDDFPALTRLSVVAARVGAPQELHDALANRFVAQLTEDADRSVVSTAGRAAPRLGSRTERLTGLGMAIAWGMTPDHKPEGAARAYRKTIAALARRKRAQERRAVRGAAAAPSGDVSVEVTRPRPVPVVPAPRDELIPLLDFLQAGSEVVRPVQFSRGTLMPDGRLDLCKQVVGPTGIGPLVDALQGNPHVERLLLGNNVVGASGAMRIAEHIRSGQSHVRVWYVAGNEFDAEAVAPICDALRRAPEVEGLWLKRNPLGPAGAVPVARLLAADTPLKTLDLVNTGLLDEGTMAVVDALWKNHHLAHLYLGTNGASVPLASRLYAYLYDVDRLESLFVDCNRLGDDGARALAEGLAHSRTLTRLSLASNRIGPVGVRALVEALSNRPRLTYLNLGWTRATAAVHERGNALGDEGAQTLGAWLATDPPLRSLDVSHNDITQRGLDHIRAGLETNTTLVALRCPQRGKATNPDRMAHLRGLVERNRRAAGIDEAGVEAFRAPEPARDVLSVYRTQPMG